VRRYNVVACNTSASQSRVQDSTAGTDVTRIISAGEDNSLVLDNNDV